MSEYLLSILLGFFGLFIFYFPVGLFLISLLHVFKRTLLKIVLSFYIGFAFVSSIYFFYGNLVSNSAQFLDFVFLIIGVILLPRTILFLRKSQVIKKVLQTFLLSRNSTARFRVFSIFCSLTLYLTVSLSGFPIGDKRYIQSGLDHDSYWHIALVNNLTESIPPSHPSSYLEVLSKYHYFYDILFVPVIRVFSTDIFALYFQVFPLLLTLLLGLSASLLAERVLKRNKYLLPFFVFFGGSFAYLLPLFLPGIQWGESSFWVSQTFATMINPQAIYTFGLLYAVIVIFYEITKEKRLKLKIRLIFLIIFLIASSIGFKSYSFLVLAVLFFSFLGHSFVLTRNTKLTTILCVLFLFFSFPYVYFVVGLGGTSSFIFAPLWFLTSMIESRDRVYYPLFKLQEEHYLVHGNYLRVLEIKLKELLIFFVGNLGTRILLVVLFLRRKILHEFKNDAVLTSILIAFLFACSFPLIFLQQGIVWKTIQVWYYGLILGNILASIAISKILIKIDQKVMQTAFIATLIFATIPTFSVTTVNRLMNHYSISLETEAWLQKNLSKNDRVLICPSDDILFTTSFVKMFAEAEILLADSVQLALVSSPVYEEQDALYNAFRTSDLRKIKELTAKHQVTKVLCSNSDYLPLIEKISDDTINRIGNMYVKKI